jgi:hypothetical protein
MPRLRSTAHAMGDFSQVWPTRLLDRGRNCRPGEHWLAQLGTAASIGS